MAGIVQVTAAGSALKRHGVTEDSCEISAPSARPPSTRAGPGPRGAVSATPEPRAPVWDTQPQHRELQGHQGKAGPKGNIQEQLLAGGCFPLRNGTHMESHDAWKGFTIPIRSSAAWLIRYYYLLCVFFPSPLSLSLFLWQGCRKRTQ